MLSDLSATSDRSRPCDGRGISLAHISDLHLPPPSIPWKCFFNKRALSRILWFIQRRHKHLPAVTQQLIEDIYHTSDIQALLISGDLTNFGTPEEYHVAVDWLKALPLSTVIVPGNHDIMVPVAPHESLDLWQPWAASGYPYCRTIGKVAIISLNSAIPTPPFTAYGMLKKEHYERLAALLTHYGRQGCCRVVMIHHPPRRDLLPCRKALVDTRRLAGFLKHYGTELVLHGHSHNATFTTVEGTDIPLLGVSSASMKSENFHRISSWNHLHFQPLEHAQGEEGKNGWKIEITRRSYQGTPLEHHIWQTPPVRPAGEPA